QPVFAWIAPFGPHLPAIPAPRHAHVQCDWGKWRPPNYNEADVSDKPAWVRALPLLKDRADKRVRLCQTLLSVDDLVAAVRAELAREGRLDDTLLFYMGDNGMEEGEHRVKGKDAPYITEIPFYASWPRGLGTSARTVAARVESIDFAPTLCELAACKLGPYP